MSINMAGECEKHNLEWYDTGIIECPVCELETELSAMREALESARHLIQRFVSTGEWSEELDSEYKNFIVKLDAVK